ncbi:DUF924 family protein [Paracoccaceae bacterium GXU_MW_L88]
MKTAQEVLDFWIDQAGPKMWYAQDEAFDAEIRDKFQSVWEEARDGQHDDWLETPEGALALCILLDQFPRNMFRGQGDSFATDAKAREVAGKAIAAGHDMNIAEPERQFFYLPFMHEPTLAGQDRCIDLMAERLPETGADNLAHAKAHRAVIEAFGRFPARNAALGRESTEGEKEYLKSNGYGEFLKQYKEEA